MQVTVGHRIYKTPVGAHKTAFSVICMLWKFLNTTTGFICFEVSKCLLTFIIVIYLQEKYKIQYCFILRKIIINKFCYKTFQCQRLIKI